MLVPLLLLGWHPTVHVRRLLPTMLALNALLVLLVHLWVSDARPLEVRDTDSNAGVTNVTYASVAELASWLRDFTQLASNRALFAQLPNADNAFYDASANVVGASELPRFNQYQLQPYVANGYIGSRIPRFGQGFAYDQVSDGPDASFEDLYNGWPLFNKRYAGAFVAGFYDIQNSTNGTNFPEVLADGGYESVMAAVPQWTLLQLVAQVDGKKYTLNASLDNTQVGNISNYAQNMSLLNGVVTTQFTWLDTLSVLYSVLAHRANETLGVVNLEVVNLGKDPVDLWVTDSVDLGTGVRIQQNGAPGTDANGAYVRFLPLNLPYIYGAIYSQLEDSLPASANASYKRTASNSSAQTTVQLVVEPDTAARLTKYAGVATTDYDPAFNSSDAVLKAARDAATAHSGSDYAHALGTHIAAWNSSLAGSGPAITFPLDPLLTLAGRASVYHLTANTRPDATGVTAAMPVGGLLSDSYAGLVFWDADVWMLTGLLAFAPAHARSIVNYRSHTHEQAVQNAQLRKMDGAVYLWTSGRFGNCTGTGPCFDYEYHINHAVAHGAWETFASGATSDDNARTVAWPLLRDASAFFADYAQFNETLGAYTTRNLTDPDEYANHVDNGAYTNAGISLTARRTGLLAEYLGESAPANVSQLVGNMHLPNSQNADNITLEYDGMNLTVGIKQADVIMVTYPLGNEEILVDQADANLQFYATKQVSYGPAMTFPIFSIVASDLAESGCASQLYLRKAVQPLLRAPFAQFSEQNNDIFALNGGTHPAFPFMTAHGGFLQAVVQGLIGLRFDHAFNAQGDLQRQLTLDPAAIPCIPGGVQLDGVVYMNQSLAMNISDTQFTVTHNGAVSAHGDAVNVTIALGERNPKAGTYTLAPGQNLSFPLYVPDKSYVRLVAECSGATFTNITEGAFGDAPISINDGDNSTHWQPRYNDTTAKVLVDLKQYRNISGGIINWGETPARLWTLLALLGLRIAQYSELQETVDILSKVDFGTDIAGPYRYANADDVLYKQDDVFSTLLKGNVSISAPFDATEFGTVSNPTRQNTTEFDFDAVYARYLLIEVLGTHNKESPDGTTGGARLYEVGIW